MDLFVGFLVSIVNIWVLGWGQITITVLVMSGFTSSTAQINVRMNSPYARPRCEGTFLAQSAGQFGETRSI